MVAALGQRFRIPRVRASTLQWMVVGTVGLVLGGYVLAISSLPLQWALLLVLAVLSPFVVIIVGNIRQLLLAVIILDIPLQLDVHFAFRPEISEIGRAHV